MLRNQKRTLLITVIMLLAFVVVGCSGAGNDPAENASKGKVELLYVEWACARAETNVMAYVLENIMGYDVEMTSVSAAAMYQGLANGEGDAVFTSWLPLTHGDYMDQVGNDVENLGPSYEGARLGWVVPTYVDIDSIEDLNGVKDKFDGQIIGIDPGAGLMKASKQAIEDYNLDYELVEGTDATMVVSLKQAIDNNEWIVATGWSPHWKFARWDLKYLDDPKKSLGESETINTIVRKGLKEDMPEVYELCDNFQWNDAQIGSAMGLAEELGNDKEAAQKWVEENMDVVNTWLPEKYKQ